MIANSHSIAGGRLRTALHGRLGSIYVRLGHWPEANTQLRASLKAARLLGDRAGGIEALLELSQSDFKQGKFEAAGRRLREAHTLAREIGDKSKTAFALMWLGAIPAIQNRFVEAERYLQEALVLAREAEVPALAARTLNILGENSRLAGRNTDALAHYREALNIYRGLDDRFGTELVTHNLGHLSVAEGDLGAANHYYLDALTLAVEIEAIPSALEILAALAGIRFARGAPEEATELLGLVLDDAACPEEARRLFAEPLLAKMRDELSPAVVDAGLARGRTLDFDAVVREILE